MSFEVHQLTPDDVPLLNALMTLFGEVFDERDAYTARRPGAAYHRRLLGGDAFIALAALKRGVVVGGLAAYELRKFEQARREVLVYDLAVAAAHRREGIATALMKEMAAIATARGAYLMFVQANTGPEDAAAIALYTKLGVREEILHFEISLADPLDPPSAP